MIKVLVVEDQAMVRGAISALLSLEDNIDVVAEAEHGQQAKKILAAEPVDIVLTDIEMPEMTGIELAEFIAQHHPNIKTVIMTTFSKVGYIKRAMQAGVKGFILKEAPSDELIHTVNQVFNGRKVIDPELAISALDDADPLNDKERKALRLASEGLKTGEIAAKLFLSEGTVRNYLSECIAKLNASNRVDAARIAKQKGWL
ncbi:response regulator transcription factor [Thalassotalea sp. LPB0316]|uniref:response regulator transcription factor n=1 Tax=Thalassotalea sp. LPB0316 TaxID=2769490 RepID=UPI001868CC55|nr:response regulator transcription factor [Thalassotalea sp. LPB0316]QOL25974.1 response regulator transcription factor [Thalassotalea sp. LPB0316]